MKKKKSISASIADGILAKKNIFFLDKKYAITSNQKQNILYLDPNYKINKIQDFKINTKVFDLNKNKKNSLNLINIYKSLGGKPILRDISINLKAGQIVGLLGPNGSGKTTIFKLIIGKLFPDDGHIYLNNEKIQNLPIHIRSQKGLSLLEQNKGLFGNMTAEENLYAILELHLKDKEEIKKKIDVLLNYFELSYLKNVKADLLSGGEYKKVSILQRICNPNISILLLDEPCAALDPLSINSLKKFIIELKTLGLSILITDHNYWAIENILDKAYLIKDGQILVEGTPDKISRDENAIKYYLGGSFKI